MGLVVWAGGVVAAGCSSSGSSLFSPPAYPLIKSAKAVRDSAPVPAPVPRELAKVLHQPFVVEPGDTLLVQPAKLDAPLRLPPDQPVFPDGTIDLGDYGRPVVAGHTAPEIEAIVQAAVKAKDKDAPTVNVRIIGRASKVYYVFGEVNAPGAFPLNGRETVLDALVAAGGLTRRSSKDNIVLSRPTPPDGCRVVYPVCWNEIVQLGDTTTNYQIQAGDRVYVPSAGMLEGLLPFCRNKHGCPACLRPQVSCFGGVCGACAGGEGPAGISVSAPATPTATTTTRPPSWIKADPVVIPPATPAAPLSAAPATPPVQVPTAPTVAAPSPLGLPNLLTPGTDPR
jgi:protein involved in polysaccharide export with SLBB domain